MEDRAERVTETKERSLLDRLRFLRMESAPEGERPNEFTHSQATKLIRRIEAQRRADKHFAERKKKARKRAKASRKKNR